MADENKQACWYVVHTYSGYENKVKDTLLKSVENSPEMQQLIFDVVVPMEDVIEIKNGRRVKSQRKVYPGYVLVHMIETTNSWYVVRNTRGVTGFVGPDSKPIALTEDEVRVMLNSEAKSDEFDIAIGETVEILDGMLAGFTGVVQEVDPIRGRLNVSTTMFNRETSTELSLDQVRRV